jgi:hypothetical protein
VAQLSPAQFQALWESAKSQPALRTASATPIQVDLSLSGILTQYMAMAGRYRDKGTIGAADYNDLAAAVAALKAILVRINDSDLVAQETAQNAAAIQRQMQTKTT